MGNLTRAKLRELFETAGASLRHLPPYSPDISLVENSCAKPPSAPSRDCGPPSDASSTAARPKNAPICLAAAGHNAS